MKSNTSAVIPAAGASRRMGRSKALLPLLGVPSIQWTVRAALAAGVREVVVVLGRDGKKVRRALAGLPVRFVEDPAAGSGMAGSVLAGLRTLSPESRDVFVLPGDHPLVSPDTLSRLEDICREDPDAIAVPLHQGQRGHPALFPVHLAMELFSPHGPGRTFRVRPDGVRQVPVPDPGILLDMDTPGDYRRIRKEARKLPGPWAPPAS